MDSPSNTCLLISTAAFLAGVLIARLTTVGLNERLKSRRLLAAGGLLTVVLLVALTYRSAPLGIGIALVATATGFLLWRRPYPQVRAELVAAQQDQALPNAQLGQSEGLYRALLEAASDAMVITQDLRIVFANRATARLFGAADSEQLVGRRAMDLIAPEKRLLAQERTAKLVAGEAAPLVETRFLKLDGSPIDVEISSAPYTLNGRPAILSIVREITERKQMEEALRRSEARFRSLTELSSDWYWEQDEEFRFTDRCSDGLAKSGFDRKKLIGRRRSELPYYAMMTATDWAPLIHATARRAPFRDVVMRLLNEHGELRHMMISGEPFLHPDGRFAGYRGVGVDVTERETQRQQLQIFRAAMETSPDAIFITDMQQMRYIDVNETTCRMLGYTREEMLQMGPQDNNPNVTKDYIRERYEEARRRGTDQYTVDSENRYLQRKDGTLFPQEIHRRYLRIGDRDLIVSVVRDISAQLAANKALRLRDRALESSVNAIVITRAEGDHELEYVNPAFGQLTGYANDEAMGRNLRFLQGEDREQADIGRLRSALGAGEECTVLLRNYTKSGKLFWNDLRIAPVRQKDGQVTHYVGVLNDITVAKQYQDELAHQATHDILTGVPNRNLLDDRLRQSIANAQRRGQLFAVVFVDLDHFKNVNDALGHKAGDAVLVEIARRLARSIRGGDTLARYAGDEFVMIMNEVKSEEVIGEALERLRQTVSVPIHLDGRELILTCSLGAALYPRDGDEPSKLLRNADAAMYQAKEEGRDGFRFFTRALNQRSHNRLAIEGRLRRALEGNELFLEYQPKVSFLNGRITGLEALLRWDHPELGLVSPAQFIPIAEESGYIVAIGMGVLHQACAQIVRWKTEHGLEVPIAINFSARQLREKDLVSSIASVVAGHHVSPALLACEVTESGMLHDVEAAIKVLSAMRELGMQVSLDDFGTGYSSLSYLKRLPLDSVKVDRSFVRDVTSDPEDAKIVQAIVGLGRALDLRVIAEGVETAAQAVFLQECGCHEAQGYFYAKPMKAREMTEWLLQANGVNEAQDKAD